VLKPFKQPLGFQEKYAVASLYRKKMRQPRWIRASMDFNGWLKKIFKRLGRGISRLKANNKKGFINN
jgi:hypothetical protein